jgi:hypothetical protein
MVAAFEPALPAAERRAVAAEWKRLEDEPPPLPRREIGCMTAVIAVLLALAGPPLLRWLGIELPPALKLALFAVLGLAILGGAFVGLVLVSGRYAHAYRQADAAVDWLARNGAGGDPEETRKQAVTLLFHAFCSDGPSTTHTIDFEGARARLGEALPYVMAIEHALRTDLQIYPVFTESKVSPPASEGL